MNNLFDFKIQYYLKHLSSKGNIVYEYNPLRNFRIIDNSENSGDIVDLNTSKLNFNLNFPVDIITQPSYDGSVNLIINDNYNIPRLINSRFTVKANNRYEIIDRIGSNDSNLYDLNTFDADTSLYKRVANIPKISFLGLFSGGSLEVGNYTFYFKYSDIDDNETDFIASSGSISCFKGNNADPFSIEGGVANENSNKSISLRIDKADKAYDYLKIYCVKSSANLREYCVPVAFKIINKYAIKSSTFTIIIDGRENVENIPISEINQRSFIINKAKSQVTCQNRLFLGNISKSDSMYEDLSDISLHILPYMQAQNAKDLIGNCNYNYYDNTNVFNKYEYYNANNIYKHVGYWNEEIYRFGIVYIMNDGSLSPVYNVRGRDNLPSKNNLNVYSNIDFDKNILPIEKRVKIVYNENNLINDDNTNLENSRGVVRFNDLKSTEEQVYSIGFAIPNNVYNYLKDKVSGFFFVRQKRIPTILAQMFTMPCDNESKLPLLKNSENNAVLETFLDHRGLLNHTYLDHLFSINEENISKTAVCAICPDYFLNQELFNQFFTGTKYPVKKALIQPSSTFLKVSPENDRVYYVERDSKNTDNSIKEVSIVGVSDGSPLVSAGKDSFRGKAGFAEEAFKFEYAGYENKDSKATNLVRGLYSAYLGISGELESNKIYNIYQQDYLNITKKDLFEVRYEDNSSYYSIGQRVIINELNKEYEYGFATSNANKFYYHDFYSGDCYIGNFTHRLNRNFQDSVSPTNDLIVDASTWKDNYDLDNKENFVKINLGDVNAVNLGSWITVKFQSNYNLSLRCEDHSYITEEALFNLPRSFYPLQPISASGEYKIANSESFNKGNNNNLGEQVHFVLPNVPYIKNIFENRIIYSDIAVTDAFKNGFRSFGYNNFRDYSSEYGGIVKLEEWKGSIICVCEHGILLIPVNERTVAGNGAGGDVFINTSNVLPENPKVLSDMFGTQWGESVLKTPYYIYGVDTVAKKIWRTDGTQVETISDFCIQRFLNENLTLTEREKTPIIGIRNVKTHYNAFKKDVMFTFYDNLHGFEEKVWNLCWNEIMQKWITFYSWVPSYSANIDNIYFSFNRDTSKWIAKLGTSKQDNSFSDGVVLSDNVIKPRQLYSPFLTLANREFPKELNYYIEYELVKDPLGFYKNFTIINRKDSSGKVTSSELRLINNNYDSLRTFLYWMNYKKITEQENPSEIITYKVSCDSDKEMWVVKDDNNETVYSFYIEELDKLNEHLYQKNEDGKYIKVVLDYRRRKDVLLWTLIDVESGAYLIEPTPYPTNIPNLYWEEYGKIITTDIYKVRITHTDNKYQLLDEHGTLIEEATNLSTIEKNLTIYTNDLGLKEWLPKEFQINSERIVQLLNIRAKICILDNIQQQDFIQDFKNYVYTNAGYYESVVAVIPEFNKQYLTTDFWKHGFAGNIDISEKIRPTYWYGKQHPFEFEVVVVDHPDTHKLFDNLQIISNNSEPESFHYEIIGDSFDISEDKTNMYIRQEFTKDLYQNNETDISYDDRSFELTPNQNSKSYLFPLYYERQDTYNDVEDYYHSKIVKGKDYSNLAGSELKYLETENQFDIVTHSKAVDIKKHGRLRGNMQYKEDKWIIQINPIVIKSVNEADWETNYPDIILGNTNIGKTIETVPNNLKELGYQLSPLTGIKLDTWKNRKELKQKDKFIKIRVRYSGEKLTTIMALKTLYSISYA